jgi:hypothetical protein
MPGVNTAGRAKFRLLCKNLRCHSLKAGGSPLVNPTTTALRRQMLEWIAMRPRERAEILEVWRTSCPRLSIWEDACIDGLIDYEAGTGKVILSEAGKALLSMQWLQA